MNYIFEIIILCSIFILSSLNASNLVYVGNSGNETLSVLDAVTLAPIAGSPFPVNIPFMAGGIQELTVNPSGTRIYISNAFNVNNVSVLDGTTFAPILGSPFPSGGSGAEGIAINPTGTRLYVVNDGTSNVSVLDGTTLAPLGLVPVGMNPRQIAVNPLGTFVYVANQGGNSVTVFNQTSLAYHMSSPIAVPNPRGIAIDSTGMFLYVVDGNGFIYLFNASTLALITGPITTGTVSSGAVIVNPDPLKPFVYVVNVGFNSISVLNSSTLLPVGLSPYNIGVTPSLMAIDPTGSLLYVTDTAGSLSVLYTSTLTHIPGSPFTSGIGPGSLGIAFGSAPILAPQTLQGSQKKDDFGLIFELFNFLEWDSSSSTVAGYFVYRDGVKIATLDNVTYQYEDHNRQPGVAAIYSVTSFDANGLESNPISVEVR